MSSHPRTFLPLALLALLLLALSSAAAAQGVGESTVKSAEICASKLTADPMAPTHVDQKDEGEGVCKPRVLETNSFTTCGIGTEAEIKAAEIAELEGLFKGACEEPCKLEIDLKVSMSDKICSNLQGKFGWWTEVKYTVRCA